MAYISPRISSSTKFQPSGEHSKSGVSLARDSNGVAPFTSKAFADLDGKTVSLAAASTHERTYARNESRCDTAPLRVLSTSLKQVSLDIHDNMYARGTKNTTRALSEQNLNTATVLLRTDVRPNELHRNMHLVAVNRRSSSSHSSAAVSSQLEVLGSERAQQAVSNLTGPCGISASMAYISPRISSSTKFQPSGEHSKSGVSLARDSNGVAPFTSKAFADLDGKTVSLAAASTHERTYARNESRCDTAPLRVLSTSLKQVSLDIHDNMYARGTKNTTRALSEQNLNTATVLLRTDVRPNELHRNMHLVAVNRRSSSSHSSAAVSSQLEVLGSERAQQAVSI